VTFIRHGDNNGLQDALRRLFEQPRRKPIPGFVPAESIAKYYSDTYLWRENCSRSVNGHESKRRAMIKKALYSVVPTKQLVEHGNRNRAQIALTIDDGPDPIYTPRILDTLRDYAVKGTFFVVGNAAE